MQTLFYIIVLVAVIVLVMRFMPVDAEPYHEDPGEPDTRRSEVRLIGREAPRFPADAEAVLTLFSEIALAEPRVRLAAGSIDEGMITFTARSKVFGFVDFITVKAVNESEGAKLSVFARPQYNVYDWGVNAKRLDRWLGELEQAFR